MRPLSAVVVMTHDKRRLECEAVEKLLRLQADPLGIPVLIARDEGWHSPRRTLMKALTMPGAVEGHRRLVIHDDLVIPKRTLEKVEYILGRLPPERFVSCYCPSNKDYDAASASGHHLIETTGQMWIQALCYVEQYIPPLLKFYEERVNPTYRWEDRPLALWMRETGLKALCVIPSMFQHLGAFRSTLGFPGKAGGRVRHSEIFDPDFEPSTVDWEKEVARAYQCDAHIPAKGIFRDAA